jgi:magnesium transporter
MPEIEISDILDEISALASEENGGALKLIMTDLHPADIADLLARLSRKERQFVFDQLDAETASEMLAEMDLHIQEQILKNENTERIVEILENLDSDDAADLVGELPYQKRKEVLAEAKDELEEDLRELLLYDDESAGGLMALELIALKANQPVIEAIQEIRREKDKVEDIYVIYIVDDFNKLVGYVTLKKLVLANPDDLLRDIMEEDIVAVTPEMDQEEVAALAKKYDLVSIPVVDKNYHLVGRITIDDIIDVLEEEASEDYNRMAGLHDEAQLEHPIIKTTFMRFPWLLIGLLGELVSALVLSSYQASIEQIIALAFFIPVVMAMGGNSGIQSSSIVIRGLATGSLNLTDTWRRLSKEFVVAIINGLLFGVVLATIIFFWLNDLRLAIVVGSVLNGIIIQAAIFGTIIPFTLKRLGFDPAIATGPFITTSNDVLGLLVYLSAVTYFLQG